MRKIKHNIAEPKELIKIGKQINEWIGKNNLSVQNVEANKSGKIAEPNELTKI